ncbi:monooxygenase [Mycobacterium sp. ENV421]|uniref:methane monooxygenase/ammonia monooxygenase subunit B n=1 Tax=Mycobacterium sp. ENV421 TaxID=1213407 RepID=UPI000C9A734B|nr:methane monooxygenase/ammonia monooxygenase subunit B [Mycobacterium sp. ENV421]PND54404.1 monooxygenase [Mycobacterium sp. ENV421]
MIKSLTAYLSGSRGRAPKRGSRRGKLAPLAAVLGLLFMLAPPPLASAHGEQSQQPFERTSTVAFYDTQFSTDRLDIGQELTITGTLRVMDSWPDHTIAPPDLGYLTVNMPGPVFTVQEREMSGMFTPQSVKVVKGGVYPYKLVLKARVPGTWHVHPAMAMEGTGTLVGEGRYITINDAGTFTEPQTLSDGSTVDLASYGIGRVVTWHVLGLLVAVVYAAYWLRKSLLQRAAVVNAGGGATLVTPRERNVSIAIAVVALVLGFGGYAYAQLFDGPHIPPQVARLMPVPQAPSGLATQLKTQVQSAVFKEQAGTLVLKISVTNNSNSPVELDRLQFADYVVKVKEGANPDTDGVATVSPSGPISAHGSGDLTVELDARSLLSRNLLPINDAQIRVTGLMFFRDTSGQISTAEINELTSGILPQYGSQ